MKILRLFSKRVRETKYYKYTITLPVKIAEQSNLVGKNLKAICKGNKIIIEEE